MLSLAVFFFGDLMWGVNFVKIYEKVFDLDVSSRAKLLLSLVLSFGDSGCTMSNKTLCKKLSCSQMSVDRAIKELVSRGFISREIKDRYKRVLKPIFGEGVNQNDYGVNQNDEAPLIKLVTYKNKEDKNTYKSEIKEIISYLNSQAKRRYRDNTASSIKPITARLNEGFTIDEFKRVIDIMVDKWANDERMKQFLRPETLFSNKFDGYLNSTEAPELVCHICNSSIRDGRCISCGEPFNG